MKNLLTFIESDLDDRSKDDLDYDPGWYNIYDELADNMQARREQRRAYSAHDVQRLLGFSHGRVHVKKGNAHAQQSRQLRLL